MQLPDVIVVSHGLCIDVSLTVCISEDPGREPEHIITSRLHIMESRLDYMGSSILVGRISDLAVKVNDEWQVEACHRDDKMRPPLTNRWATCSWPPRFRICCLVVVCQGVL